MARFSKAARIVTAVLAGAAVLAALWIMVRGRGLVDTLDFGAGAYYYADIPDFERYQRWDAFKAALPYGVYALLFLLWGLLMYLLWKWIDRR